jgi:hypothetical protein
VTNSKRNKLYKKINMQINYGALTNNFNSNNIDTIKRRKNNKSLFNFLNIFFSEINHIINNYPESNNPNLNFFDVQE